MVQTEIASQVKGVVMSLRGGAVEGVVTTSLRGGTAEGVVTLLRGGQWSPIRN